MVSKLTPSNVIKLANMTVLSNANLLREKCLAFLLCCGRTQVTVTNIKDLEVSILQEYGALTLKFG